MDEFDQAYGHAPDEFDQAYQPEHDEFDKAYAAADGTAAGQAAGDALARLQQGEVKSAPADWGDVGTSALKVLLGQDDYSQQLLGKPGLSPQEKEAYYGTVLPTAIVGGSLLAGGPGAGLVAREALGLTTGAASRAAIAKARGDDPLDAATGYDRQTGEIHPAGPLIDAGMSALPEALAAAKMGWNALPSAATAPINAIGSRLASGTSQLLASAIDRLPGGPVAAARARRSLVSLLPQVDESGLSEPGLDHNYAIMVQGEPAGSIKAHTDGGNFGIDWLDLAPEYQGRRDIVPALRTELQRLHPDVSTYSGMRVGGGRAHVIDERPFRMGSAATPVEPSQSVTEAIARRYPGFGEKLVDETGGGFGLHDIFDRPPLEEPPDYGALAQKMEPGIQAPTGSSGLQQAKEALWNGAIRSLRQSDSELAQTAGNMIDRANNIERSITNSVRPHLQSALDAIPPEASANVASALEGGIGSNVDPATAALARPLRSILRDVNDMRQGQGVWDEVNRARALDLMDQGVPVQTFGEHQFAPAQTTNFFFPHRTVPTPDGNELSGIERIIANNPELTVAQAERRLGGLQSSGAIGHARTAEEAPYSMSVHDVLPGYLDQEAKRIANASVFGGKPTKIRVEVGGGGGRDIVVGDKGAALYRHLFATGQYDEARQFLAGLEARYAPPGSSGMSWARGLSSKASDMALSHSWATQIGQSGTGMALAGGPQQAVRGAAMVEANPVLKQIFAAGPQSNQITDYIAMGRGGEETGAATPMQAMHGIENWLRGPASYSAVPMIYDTAHEAKALADAGQPFTGALAKKAAEMGTTPDYLAQDLSRNGTLSPGTWLNSIQSLANRWQHTAGPGDLPNYLRTPTGALLGQYKTFGIKQSQLVMDDIVKPLMSSDPSLRALGQQRAAMFAATNVPLNAANIGVRSLVSGRLPTTRALLRGALTGPTGIAGDAAYALGSSVAPKYGDDPMSQFSEIPSVAIPLGAAHDVMGAYYEPGRAAQGALRLAGAVDPRIPMYGSAPLGLLRGAMGR